MKKEYARLQMWLQLFDTDDVITGSPLSDEVFEQGVDAERRWWGE